jgi:hypothetical protein
MAAFVFSEPENDYLWLPPAFSRFEHTAGVPDHQCCDIEAAGGPFNSIIFPCGSNR